MPFEPLGTDEKLDRPAKKKQSMDSAFLAGCTTVAFLSLLIWGVAAWPFFVFEMHLRQGLISASLAGFLPALAVGAFSVAKAGMTGATGFAGGAFSVGLFAYLQLENLTLGNTTEIANLPPTDYPEFWAWLMPIIWCLLVVVLILLFLPKGEFEDEGGPGSSR